MCPINLLRGACGDWWWAKQALPATITETDILFLLLFVSSSVNLCHAALGNPLRQVSQSVVGAELVCRYSDDPEESLEDGFLLFYFCSTYTLSGGSNASESGGYGEH